MNPLRSIANRASQVSISTPEEKANLQRVRDYQAELHDTFQKEWQGRLDAARKDVGHLAVDTALNDRHLALDHAKQVTGEFPAITLH